MKAPTFEPGEELGNVRIIALVHEGANQKETKYMVSRVCCGDEMVLTHHRVSLMRSNDIRMCRKCRKAGVVAEPRRSNGVMVESGSMRGWWPTLSPMGFRGA